MLYTSGNVVGFWYHRRVVLPVFFKAFFVSPMCTKDIGRQHLHPLTDSLGSKTNLLYVVKGGVCGGVEGILVFQTIFGPSSREEKSRIAHRQQ